MTYKLVLLRHGQSAWNKTNQFTGWVDVPLTEQGEAEAKRGGELLKEKNVLPDIVFTSLLRRAINTANIALDAADRLWIPVQRDWRLNERHYGALQGKNKTEIREEYGDEKFMLWRRSYATPPPEIDPNDQYAQNNDPRYAGDPVPEAECLANVVERVKPYFESAIEPELKAGKTVLIAAHGNSSAPSSRCWTTCLRKRSPRSTSRPPSRCSTSWTRTSSRSSRVASTWTRRLLLPVPPLSPLRARSEPKPLTRYKL